MISAAGLRNPRKENIFRPAGQRGVCPLPPIREREVAAALSWERPPPQRKHGGQSLDRWGALVFLSGIHSRLAVKLVMHIKARGESVRVDHAGHDVRPISIVCTCSRFLSEEDRTIRKPMARNPKTDVGRLSKAADLMTPMNRRSGPSFLSVGVEAWVTCRSVLAVTAMPG
jgi:hypothetical protein